MSDRTPWKITTENGQWSMCGKKKGKKPGPVVHDDLCVVTDENGQQRHVFTAEEPNQLWLTDITEHWNPSRAGKALSLRDLGHLL